MAKIGFAVTGSHCTTNIILDPMRELVEAGHDVIPIASASVLTQDTRFGKAEDLVQQIQLITGKKILSTVEETESLGPKNPLDLIVVAPATGNFIARFANAITDNGVHMAVKATLRNQKPIVLAISTNDALGLNGQNIVKLLNQKNVYFVPFSQDDPLSKQNSLVAHFDLIIPTINAALEGKQYQPLLRESEKGKELIKKNK